MSSLSDYQTASRRHAKEIPTYLNVKQVAQLVNVKPRTIYEMVAQRRIPYCKPLGSNILRFDLDEILDWMKAGVNS